uniref:Uncharacterized protein n=1 Tax=Panagrolaimus davidi TaxID=227884 RepID=A0A914QE19_9BILA
MIFLRRVIVTNDIDHSVVALEDIIRVLPKLDDFEYYMGNPLSKKYDMCDHVQYIFGAKTFSELFKVQRFTQLKKLYLAGVCETISVDVFNAYIKVIRIFFC